MNMSITHKVDLSNETVAKIREGFNFLNIPKTKIPELMDSTIQLMKALTLMLKIVIIFIPITLICFILSLFMKMWIVP
jgi:hypothetical protein